MILFKTFLWIKKHKRLSVLIGFSLFLLPLIIVHLLYKWRTPFYLLQSNWDSGDLIAYIAGFEAFFGTVFLGIVAVWQNDKANELTKIILNNEEKHRKFERQPSLMLCRWEFTPASDDEIFRNANPILSYDESFLFTSIIDDENLYILNITLINSSKAFTEFSLDHFRLIQDIDGGERVDYSNIPLSCEQERFHIAPMKEITFGFVLNRHFFSNCLINRASFGITMRNSIGELYSELIEFSIGNGDIVFSDGYYIIPLAENSID